MKKNWIFFTSIAFLIYLITPTEEKRLYLRPMTANEVYRVLREAGREDAIPQGRVVTQGIAAATGFALGIKKGVAGSLLFDLATSNETQQYLTNLMSNMNSWNMSMPEWGNWFGYSGGGSSPQPTSQTQEICFNTRSLNDINDDYTNDDDGDDANDYDEANERRIITTHTTNSDQDSDPTFGATTTPGIDEPSFDVDEPDFATSPQLTVPTLGETTTSTLTNTGGSGNINCIVINKPVAKKRRRRSIDRSIRRMKRSNDMIKPNII